MKLRVYKNQYGYSTLAKNGDDKMYISVQFKKGDEPNTDKTEIIISQIVEGILNYSFYSPKEYKLKPVENAFDYMLRQDFKNMNSYDMKFWEEFFWYSEDKDDRLLKKLRSYNSNLIKDCFWRMREKFPDYYRQEKNYIDVELEEKYAEFIRDELDDDTGDFYYNYYRAKVEYYKIINNVSESNGIATVISFYQKAFKKIYNGGNFTDSFISDFFKLYSPIQKAKRIYENKKTSLKYLEDSKKFSSITDEDYEIRKKQIEELFEANKKSIKDYYGLDISKSSIREVEITPLKQMWQWAEAAGIVNKSYSNLKEEMDGNIRGGTIWSSHLYNIDNSLKVKENYELLIKELEKEETTIYIQ